MATTQPFARDRDRPGDDPSGSDQPGDDRPGSDRTGSDHSADVEPLWRQLLGRRLRWLRLQRGETLAETARRAGVSPQYLSEIERGIKEPSSEMVAAIAGALDATLLDLTSAIAWELTAAAEPARVHRLAPARLAPARLAPARPAPARPAASATYALAA